MCNKGIDILELIEDTVEVNAKTFGLKVLEKVAALDVDDKTMAEFQELVSFWADKMEDDVEYLLDLIGYNDCDCDCCEDDCDCCEDDCCCDEDCCEDDCDCGCHYEDCCCDETCDCGCQEGEPCTCEHEHCDCGCQHKDEE
ncbi:MAG: hypothetical protein J6Q51_02650 [Clostridia bacterium]|nr:hypothetical protein [Clostridia bacterium]